VDHHTDRTEQFDDSADGDDTGTAATVPTALIVGAGPEVVAAIRSAAERSGVTIETAAAGEAARAAILARRYDVVLVTDPEGRGDGARFAQLVSRVAPTSKTILLATRLSIASVVEAMRRGAVDVVRFPFEPGEFQARLLEAIDRSRDDRKREDRLVRLRGICKRLSEARTAKLEPAAPGSAEAAGVGIETTPLSPEEAMVAEYRALLRQELDLEELLRSGVEYLIGKTGPSNAAVFLPGGDGEWTLGAYVDSDCPRTVAQPMLDRLASDLCPELAGSDDLMRFEDTAEFVASVGLGDSCVAGSEIVAWPCLAARPGSEERDCLAVFVLFRGHETGFSDELASVIDALRGVFAEQVATVLRVHHRATGGWPTEREAHDGTDGQDGEDWEGRRAA
jgi:FixJ family two-component response regulator